MRNIRKLLLPFMFLFLVCHSYGQEIKVSVLSYNHSTKKVKVKVENNSNDSIWYALFPEFFIDNRWTDDKCEIMDNADLRRLMNSPKRVAVYHKLGNKEVVVREGYATEAMLDWRIYNNLCFMGTGEFIDVPKFSKKFWRIFNEEKKKYNFNQIEKRIRLKAKDLRTNEYLDIDVCSEVFK